MNFSAYNKIQSNCKGEEWWADPNDWSYAQDPDCFYLILHGAQIINDFKH